MKIRKLLGEGIKLAVLLGAIVVVLWSMPEPPGRSVQPTGAVENIVNR